MQEECIGLTGKDYPCFNHPTLIPISRWAQLQMHAIIGISSELTTNHVTAHWVGTCHFLIIMYNKSCESGYWEKGNGSARHLHWQKFHIPQFHIKADGWFIWNSKYESVVKSTSATVLTQIQTEKWLIKLPIKVSSAVKQTGTPHFHYRISL